jgi:photosystem II stability/assembly factor-like uncharacterized protein
MRPLDSARHPYVLSLTPFILGAFILLGIAGAAPQQAGETTSAAASMAPGQAHLSHLEWRNIGPAVTGGRIVEFAVVESDPLTIYAATASSGVWKTTNGGITWNPVFEKENSVALGGIAVARTNPNVVWVGTGEPNARNLRSSSWGDGVYKSEDGGKTWTNKGLTDSLQIGRIRIHPENPDIVYVSAVGPLSANDPQRNAARGLYKTTDGGESWTKVLSVGEKTGVVDVVLDPRDPDTLYAGAWQRERRDWSYVSVGPEGGIFRSTDGGESWQKLASGLPEGEVGRPGITVCDSNPDTVYAIMEGEEGGLYRSLDRGASWELRSDAVSSSMYYGQVICDPQEPDTVYVLGTQFSRSDDGGKTFREDIVGSSVHVDHHALWIDPSNTDRLLLGNDGGIYVSNDRGANWRFVPNMPITQFYTVAVDMQEPFYYVYGGTQDNNSLGGPSGTRNTGGIVNDDWFVTVGGDGFFLQIDPVDRHIVYTESQYGRLTRFDSRTGERRLIQPQAPEGETYRWNWSAPVLLSQHDNKTIYFGAQYLFRSVNRGDAWETISPDLTRAIEYDARYLMSPYGTIRIITESPLDADVIAVGTDDGLIQISGDGGASWQALESFPGVPELAQVSRLALSAHDLQTVYAAFTAHEDWDFRPLLLKSTDQGATWISIAGDLPADQPIRAFAEHPRNPDLLFAGTEFGVFVTFDGGQAWHSLKGNLPTVAIHDMLVHPRENDLVVGTHGRGFWILDQINMLEEISADSLQGGIALFGVRPAMQFNRFNRGKDNQGDTYFRAPNPPDGAILDYWVDPALMQPTGSEADETGGDEDSAEGDAADPGAAGEDEAQPTGPPPIHLDIYDAEGSHVRRLDVPQGKKGSGGHRVIWDMRHASSFAGIEQTGGRRFVAPWVLPGEYAARLAVGDHTATTSILIKPDPMSEMSPADRRTWHDTLVLLEKMAATAQAASTTAEQLAESLASAQKAAASQPGVPVEIEAQIATLSDSTQELQGEISQVSRRVRQSYSSVHASNALPTADQSRIAQESYDTLSEQLASLQTLIEYDLPALQTRLEETGIPWSLGRPLIMPNLSLPAPQRR